MSKAILVIELDDEWLDRINTTYDEMFADVTIYKKESLENQCDYSQRLYRCWCPLKSLPQKLDDKLTYKKENYYEIFAKNYVGGWNNCIDEILGEE